MRCNLACGVTLHVPAYLPVYLSVCLPACPSGCLPAYLLRPRFSLKWPEPEASQGKKLEWNEIVERNNTCRRRRRLVVVVVRSCAILDLKFGEKKLGKNLNQNRI